MSDDLDALLRWERSGGTWRVVGRRPGWVHLALLTCDGGDQMAVLSTQEPDVRAHVDARRRG
jgi:hypothetical protein